MSNKFQARDRGTVYLLPPSIDDWLPERHLARLIVDVVGELDLGPLAEHDAKLAERAKRIEERGRHRAGREPQAPVEKGPGDKDQVNLTDPESRVMLSKSGFN